MIHLSMIINLTWNVALVCYLLYLSSSLLTIRSGISITPDEIYANVENYISSNNISGWASLGPVISALKATPQLRWANPLEVKNATDRVFVAKFGPKEGAKAKGKVSCNLSPWSCAKHT